MLTRKETIGEIGENLVQIFLGGTLSEDKYDSVKDLILNDGTFVEVKTQPRWQKHQCFTLNGYKEINLKKCQDVDRLIFVEPTKSGKILLFEAPEKSQRNFYVRYVGNNKRFCLDINTCKLIEIIENKKINNTLIKLSKTPYKFITP
jgi:phosphosulfolactate synthase (CoM biosynthesis protein A)